MNLFVKNGLTLQFDALNSEYVVDACSTANSLSKYLIKITPVSGAENCYISHHIITIILHIYSYKWHILFVITL